MKNETLKDIMLVEDDPDIREIAGVALGSIGGFNLTTCMSGKEALNALSTTIPQLILLDVVMPDMDGITLLRQIKQIPKLSKTLIVFMTANTQSQEMTHYHRMGAVDVITKPFDPVKLPEILLKIWERS